MLCTMLGQSFFQLIVLLLVLFQGAGPEAPYDLSEEERHHFVFEDGGFFSIPTGNGRAHDADPTQHFTIIFNCFVFMQLFNWINCRKVHFELNAFEGLQNNLMFIAIWMSCLCVQIILVTVPGLNWAFDAASLGGIQWLFCIGCGAVSLLAQFPIILCGRSIKPHFCREPKRSEEEDAAVQAILDDEQRENKRAVEAVAKPRAKKMSFKVAGLSVMAAKLFALTLEISDDRRREEWKSDGRSEKSSDVGTSECSSKGTPAQTPIGKPQLRRSDSQGSRLSGSSKMSKGSVNSRRSRNSQDLKLLREYSRTEKGTIRRNISDHTIRKILDVRLPTAV
jgi:hypothetical protein